VLADRVILADGPVDCDAEWRARLLGILRGAHVGAVMGEDRIVQRAALKAALFRHHGALAVDLESGGVARAAVARGVPFAVIRAIADPATRDLPAAALVGLKEDGGIALGAVLGSLLRTPAQLPKLIAAGRDSRAALAALLRGARDLAAELRVT
jgi:hypothetical protein